MPIDDSQTVWLFIDYENVPYKISDILLYRASHYFIFVGKNQILEIPEEASKSKIIEIVQIEGSGKNNLDFHLTYYLGLKNSTAPKETRFVVFSKDKGFLHLMQFIKKTGRNCQEIFELPFLKTKTNHTLIQDLEKVLKNLKKIKPPAKLSALFEHLSHLLKQDENSVNLVIQELIDSNYIKIDEKKNIHYSIK